MVGIYRHHEALPHRVTHYASERKVERLGVMTPVSPTRRRMAQVVLACIAALAVSCGSPQAQEARSPAAVAPSPAVVAPSPAAVAPAELEKLIATLEDDQARTELLAQLRALVDAQRATAKTTAASADSIGARLLGDLSARAGTLSTEFVQAAEIVLDVPRLFAWLDAQMSDGAARAAWLATIATILLALAAAEAARWLVSRALRRARRALAERSDKGWIVRLAMAVSIAAIDLLAVAAFAIAANAVLPLTEPAEVTGAIVLALVGAVVLARALLIAARAAIAPDRNAQRLVPLSDESAHYVYLWARRFVTVGVVGYFTVAAAAWLAAPMAITGTLSKLAGLLLTVMAVMLVLQTRAGIARAIAGDGERAAAVRARIGEFWHVFAIVYVVGLYAVWSLGMEGGFGRLTQATVMTALIIVIARLAIVGARRVLDRGFALGVELRQRFPALEARANRYLTMVHSTVRAVIWLLALVSVAQAWGLDMLGVLAAPAAIAVIGGAVRAALIIVVALAFLEIVGSVIERYLGRRVADTGTPQLSARIRTVLPLLRNALRVVVGVIVALVLLSEVGIDIGPLLAGVGVLGLAIGFGAQKLVQDVITGLFILIEDTIHVGEVARAGGHVGLVEGLTIRTIRMRDLSGTVHVIPFSEVTTIENLTRDFSYAVIEAGVAYREDTDDVVEVLKEVAEDLRGDPAFAADILEPLEVLGVDALADSAVVIKVRLKTVPIKQWGVKREFNRRMKKAFDARGIEIPFPHQTVYFGVDKRGDAPPAHVAMAPPEGDGSGGPAES